MNSKKLSSPIQDKNVRDFLNSNDYPTIDDLIREQQLSKDRADTVHHRRDLDSLG